MSIRSLLARFASIYLVLLLALAGVMSLFGVRSPAGGTAVLIGTVLGCCLWFGRRNGRNFTRSEWRTALIGMLLVDIAIQFLFTMPLMALEEGIDLRAVALGLAFVALLHAAAIWVFIGLARQLIAKQLRAEDR
jgi:hypothetical protein